MTTDSLTLPVAPQPDSAPTARPGRGQQREFPQGSVAELFRVQSVRTPDAIALRHGEQTLSYRQLSTAVDTLAARLLALGVAAGELVGLGARRSVEVVVGMLAILQTGAAYVPVDPETPPLRVEHIVRQAGLRRVLAHADVRPLFAGTNVELLSWSGDEHSAPDLTNERRPARDDLAYVIFTSGSSGVPKGVEVRHVSLANHALNMAELYALGPSDRVLCSASFGFDVAAEQIYPALLVGAEVVIRPASLFTSLQAFNRFVQDAAITALVLPTAFFHEWTHELGAGRLTLPSALRVIGVGTEQVAASALTTLLASAPRPLRFVHGYGPTEATVTCTAYLHDGRSFDAHDVVPIGRPLSNIDAYVLDAQRRFVPDGQVGELYIGGVALARGYLGLDELTRERFIEHRVADDDFVPERLYRTGDLAKQTNGELYFVGRADAQLKVRGHRVEPEEIEALLKQQTGVLDAAVVQREVLIAYVASEGTLDTSTLRAVCRQRLPSYMVPASFVQLRQLPKTTNHKVDRAALRALAHQHVPDELASGDGELLVARAFAEVLGTQRIGRDDDFFEHGGDSLRALRVLQLLRENHSTELALVDLFEAPTVRELGLRVTRGGSVDRASVLCLKTGVGTPLFLVAGIQIYQALADRLTAENPVYALLLPSEVWSETDAQPTLPDASELAAQYIALMRRHTPHGPYALGGLSFGGALAYQMAQQLTSLGERVELLVLLDTVLPRATRRASRAWIKSQLALLRAPGQLRVRLSQRVRREWLRARNAWSPFRDERSPATGLADAATQRLERMREAAYAERLAAFDRALTPYAGSVVLYRAAENSEGSLLAENGFAGFLHDLTVQEVPGDHLGILREPGVSTLAAHLAGRLTR